MSLEVRFFCHQEKKKKFCSLGLYLTELIFYRMLQEQNLILQEFYFPLEISQNYMYIIILINIQNFTKTKFIYKRYETKR